MSGLIVDTTGPRAALVAGQHLGAGGLAGWASELVRTAMSAVGLDAEVRGSALPSRTEWSVEVHLSGQAVLLVDIDSNERDQRSLDRLELRAARTWHRVTRDAAPFEPRPWLGAIRIRRDRVPGALRVERLEQLVNARMLDAACVVAIDEDDDDVWSPSPAMSIESFQSALVGRCLVLSTLQQPA